MSPSRVEFNNRDKGGRRLGLERRQFSYDQHIPERRCGEDRRSGLDRRSGKDRRTSEDRRNGAERAVAKERRSGKNRRSGIDRREYQNQPSNSDIRT